MKNKKLFTVMLVLTVVLALIAGCSSGNGSANGSGNPSSPPESTSSTPPSEPAAEEDTSWADKKLELKYSSWEDEKVTNAMLDAFMKKYPNITVTLDKSVTWPLEETLATAAAAGTMPDVFWMKDVPLAVQNDWVMDISEFWDKDPDAAMVFPNLTADMVYSGQRFATPTFQFPMGVFINKTLFEKNNVPLPEYNWKTTDMIDLAKKLSNPAEYYYGISGAFGNLSFEDFFPMQYDQNLGYGTWDGNKFNYTNQLWIDAYNQKVELINLKVNDVMTGDEKKEVFGTPDVWTFLKGHVAMQIDGAWNLSWIRNEMKNSGAGEVDFWPFPGGTAGQRMPAYLDYVGVSSTTVNAKAAYELSKFMTWGKDGWLTRIDVMKELGLLIDRFPVSGQPEFLAKLEAELKSPGEQAVLQHLSETVPLPSLPGFSDFQRWDNEQQFSEKLKSGEYKAADKAKEFEDKANEFVSTAMEKLNFGK